MLAVDSEKVVAIEVRRNLWLVRDGVVYGDDEEVLKYLGSQASEETDYAYIDKGNED